MNPALAGIEPDDVRRRMELHLSTLLSAADTDDTALPTAFTTASPTPAARFRPSDSPRVSFVIVTYGTGAMVIDSLTSLERSLPADLAIEVLVVDNLHPRRPTSTIHQLALATTGVRVVRPGVNLGFGGGCAFGIRHTTGQFVMLANPDLMYQPGWIEPLLESMLDPTVSIASPVLLDHDGALQEAGYFLFADGQTRPDQRPLSSAEVREPAYASAACWLMRRQVYEDVGGFDPVFHPAYYEDVDLFLRTRGDGGRCVVTGASQVVHLLHQGTPAGKPGDVSRQRRLLLERWPAIPATFPSIPPELV